MIENLINELDEMIARFEKYRNNCTDEEAEANLENDIRILEESRETIIKFGEQIMKSHI